MLDTAGAALVTAQLQAQFAVQQRDTTLNQLLGNPDLPLAAVPRIRAGQGRARPRAARFRPHHVRAPISGTATQVDNIQVGRFVAAGTPILSVIDDQAPWVDANPKETDITYLRVGQKATLDVDSFPDHTFKGTVVAVSPGTGAQFSILPPQNATGNWVKVVQRVPVRIAFDKDEDTHLLRSGMSVNVEIDTGHSRLPLPVGRRKSRQNDRAHFASMSPKLRRMLITVCAMTATIMQALDTTIANVALPYMQGSLSASLDQINWVLTSYIVAAAIMTAPIGWMADRFGRKKLFIICVAGFTVASFLCALAQNIEQMVLFRLLQGMAGAALVPLSQSVLLDAYSLEERGSAMAIWGVGVMLGPIMGPTLGAWLTDNYSWHWVFLINLPIGVITVIGMCCSWKRRMRHEHLRFDWFGFIALAIGIGSLQLMLDRGEQVGWFGASEIWIEMIVSIVGFYYFFAHSLTTPEPFVRFELFKDRNFVSGCVFMVVIGVVLFGTMALVTPFMQNLLGFPIQTAGFLLGSRGVGTLLTMLVAPRLMRLLRDALSHPDGPAAHRRHALLHDRLFARRDAEDDRRHQRRAGHRPRPVVRADHHGGVPDAARAPAQRRHLDPHAGAQHRLVDRHFHGDRQPDQQDHRDARAARRRRDAVQRRAADAGRRHEPERATPTSAAPARRDRHPAGGDDRLSQRLQAADDPDAGDDPAGADDRHRGDRRPAQSRSGRTRSINRYVALEFLPDHLRVLAERRHRAVERGSCPARCAAGAGRLTGPLGASTVMRRRCGCFASSAESLTRAKAMSAAASFSISGSTSSRAKTAATAPSVSRAVLDALGIGGEFRVGAERGVAQHLLRQHAPFAVVLDRDQDVGAVAAS